MELQRPVLLHQHHGQIPRGVHLQALLRRLQEGCRRRGDPGGGEDAEGPGAHAGEALDEMRDGQGRGPRGARHPEVLAQLRRGAGTPAPALGRQEKGAKGGDHRDDTRLALLRRENRSQGHVPRGQVLPDDVHRLQDARGYYRAHPRVAVSCAHQRRGRGGDKRRGNPRGGRLRLGQGHVLPWQLSGLRRALRGDVHILRPVPPRVRPRAVQGRGCGGEEGGQVGGAARGVFRRGECSGCQGEEHGAANRRLPRACDRGRGQTQAHRQRRGPSKRSGSSQGAQSGGEVRRGEQAARG
mmetsp:Transcript_15015/g.63199  ORF Transcript_15015/g.63199 Transcript_15015/m.63199 type:complete len:297 (+) Transcript_15015:201-1091(+)